MTADLIARIVEQRKQRLGVDGAVTTQDVRASALSSDQPFLSALRKGAAGGPAVIAEVKMGSPRLGDLRSRIDPEAQARAYREAGATALSVVVEPDFFHGSYELLRRCHETSGLPAIAKDFLVSEAQMESAVRSGATAVLLIAALYAPEDLWRWADLARSAGLVPLIETHDRTDLDKLAGREWELVGVNNRDLRTFEVDLEHSESMARLLPEQSIKVAESGIESRSDVERLQTAGFDAFLIGQSLLLAEDPQAKLRELLG